MCSINHDFKAVFIHVHKTGGTYISYMLHTYYGFKNYYLRRPDHDTFCKNRKKNTKYINYENRLHGVYMYYKTSPFINKKMGMTPEKWKNYYKFCFIRNPYDKIVSAWNHINRFKIPFENYLSLKNTCNDVEYMHMFLPQVRNILNEKGKIGDMNYIGKFETLENDFQHILRNIGITKIVHPVEKKLNKRPHEEYTSYYTQSALEKVNLLLGEDFSLLGGYYKICANLEELHATGDVTRDATGDERIDAPGDAPINERIDVSINKGDEVPINKGDDVSINERIDVSINERIDVPINERIDMPINERTDMPIDVTINAPGDVSIDERIDVPGDVSIDIPIDMPIDIPIDVTINAPGDVLIDVPIDVPIDERIDVPGDAPIDGPCDVPCDVPIDVPGDAPIDVPVDVPENSAYFKIACLYAYYEKNNRYKYNLLFFLEHGLLEHVDYIFIINGKSSVTFPSSLPNVRVYYRPNMGYDFGAFSHGLQEMGTELHSYDYLFFMNTSVIGPIRSKFTQYDWTLPFLELFHENVKIVGTTINICRKKKIGPYDLFSIYGKSTPYIHVQTMFFAIDKEYMSHLQKIRFFNENEINMHDFRYTISYKEIGLSHHALSNGWNINCLVDKYKNRDYIHTRDDINFSSRNGDPYYMDSYFGESIHKEDVIFFKMNRFV